MSTIPRRYVLASAASTLGSSILSARPIKPSINARHCGALRHVAEGVLVDSTPTRYVFGADCASAAVTLVTATAKTRIAFRLILLP